MGMYGYILLYQYQNHVKPLKTVAKQAFSYEKNMKKPLCQGLEFIWGDVEHPYLIVRIAFLAVEP